MSLTRKQVFARDVSTASPYEVARVSEVSSDITPHSSFVCLALPVTSSVDVSVGE